MRDQRILLGIAVGAILAIAATGVAGSEPRAESSASAKRVAKKALRLAKRNRAAIAGVEAIPGPPGPKGEQGNPGPSGEPGPTEGFATDFWDDQTLVADGTTDQTAFTTGREGRLLVLKPLSRWKVECSAGNARLWLELDGVRLPGSALIVSSGESHNAIPLIGISAAPVAAGEHVAAMAYACPNGDLVNVTGTVAQGVSAVVLGG